MQQYHNVLEKPLEFEYTEKFLKSVIKYCATMPLKKQFIDALTKVIYRIPSSGLGDVQIKEIKDLKGIFENLLLMCSMLIIN